jgi:hypothetical protein
LTTGSKIRYTELKLSCRNNTFVKTSIYSNGDLDLWSNDPKINRVLPLPQGKHVAKFGKDPIYRTKVMVRKPVWTPAIPNHIIRTVSRRAYKNMRLHYSNYIIFNTQCVCKLSDILHLHYMVVFFRYSATWQLFNLLSVLSAIELYTF